MLPVSLRKILFVALGAWVPFSHSASALTLDVFYRYEKGIPEVSIDRNPKGKKERIAIRNPSPLKPEFDLVFSNFGLMYIISPYFPEKIRINFELNPYFQKLIQAMYAHEKRAAPVIQTQKNPLVDPKIDFEKYATSPDKVLIPYSGGKDSMFNLINAWKKYGRINVGIIHFGGLNRSVGPQEYEAVVRQTELFDIQNAVILDTINGSTIYGAQIMRAREIFFAGVSIPYALALGASKILTEGNEELGDDYEFYSGTKKAYLDFNSLMKKAGVGLQVGWIDTADEFEVLEFMIKKHPEWLKEVQNCLTLSMYRNGQLKYWKSVTPNLAAHLYPSQCGSCPKCRCTTIARILDDPELFASVPAEELEFYIQSARRWQATNDKIVAGLYHLPDRFSERLDACVKLLK